MKALGLVTAILSFYMSILIGQMFLMVRNTPM